MATIRIDAGGKVTLIEVSDDEQVSIDVNDQLLIGIDVNLSEAYADDPHLFGVVVGWWPDGEDWERLAFLPATPHLDPS